MGRPTTTWAQRISRTTARSYDRGPLFHGRSCPVRVTHFPRAILHAARSTSSFSRQNARRFQSTLERHLGNLRDWRWVDPRNRTPLCSHRERPKQLPGIPRGLVCRPRRSGRPVVSGLHRNWSDSPCHAPSAGAPLICGSVYKQSQSIIAGRSPPRFSICRIVSLL